MAGDKTYVTDSNNLNHRATRVKKVTPTDIVWSSNPNDYTVQVLIDGKWHRAILTYDVKNATFFDNINIDKALITGADGKSHTALIVKPEAESVTMSPIQTDEHSTIVGTTTGETVLNTYSETWSDVQWQDNVNVYKVIVVGSDGKKHTALLTTTLGGSVEVIVMGVPPLVLPDAIADSLEYLKAFGGTEQRNLPSGYTELEYIESTGTQYIDTGFYANNGMILDAKVLPVNGRLYIGSITNNYDQTRNLIEYDNGNYRPQKRNSFGTNYPEAGISPAVIHLDTTGTKLYCTINDNIAVNTTVAELGEQTVTVKLGELDFSGTIISGRYYYVKIKDSTGSLVRNFIPCKNTSNVIGMYDTVSQTFFTNAGTGTFAAGGEAVPTPDTPMDIISNNGVLKARHQSGLPLSYTLLDYIESTGTQYIYTNLTTNQGDISYVLDFMPTELPESGYYCILGRDSTYQAGYNTSGQAHIGNTASTDVFYSVNTKVTVSGTLSSTAANGVYYVDGVNTGLTRELSVNTPVCLFSAGTGHVARGKLYNFSATRSGNTIMNLIPAKNSSNVVGMYDLVNGVFYQNAGTGTFTAGNAVSDPVEIYADSASKNLFDKDVATTGAYIDKSNGSIVLNQPNYGYTDYIPVVAGEQYYINARGNSTTDSDGVTQYNSSKEWQSGTAVNSLGGVYTVPEGISYIRCNFIVTKLDTLQIEQGLTATPYVPYWNTTETINVHGKNWFDKNAATLNKYVSRNGTIIDTGANIGITDYIKVLPNKQYTISPYIWNISDAKKYINYYDANKSLLGIIAVDTYQKTFTTPANAVYIISSFPGNNIDDFQLELGDTATAYEPYYNGGTATAEMLLKVGDYEDVQEIIDGVVTRKVGIKVLDGTENWIYYSAQEMCYINTNLNITTDYQNASCMCTHFKNVSYSEGTATPYQNLVCFPSMTTFGIVCFRNTSFTTEQQYKDYFAQQYANGTPVIMVYQLATPTTESVAGQALQVQQGDNIVEITQAAIDGLELEAKYQAAVTLTIQEVQDANLDPNVQVTIN